MSTLKFLVVEDNATFARCVVRLLVKYGAVIAAGTVRDAMKTLAVHADLSAIIVDLGLPDGLGLEVLSAFRAAYPTLPALVVTGTHEPAAINMAYDFGADYIVKPFSGVRLRQFVEARVIHPSFRVSGTVALFSRREREVIELALLGHDNKIIASDLGIADSTVRVLLARAAARLGTLSRDDLLKRASILGLVPGGTEARPGRERLRQRKL